MNGAIFSSFARLTSSLVLGGLLVSCSLADPRPRCVSDAHCGIGVCNAGFCDDPPLPDDPVVEDRGDLDEDAPAPIERDLVCDGDPAELDWFPVGDTKGGVFGRAVVVEGNTLLVGGQDVLRLEVEGEPTLEVVEDLTRRHDAAGVAASGDRLAVVGGEDLGERIDEDGVQEASATSLEIFIGDNSQQPTEVDVDLDQAAWLPGEASNLIVSHRGSGVSQRFDERGGKEADLSPIPGRQLLQTPNGVLAIGNPIPGEPFVLRIQPDDSDWVPYINDHFATDTWTDMAIALDEATGTVFLAGGLADGEPSTLVVKIESSQDAPTVIGQPADLQSPRVGASAVFADDGLFVIGGDDGRAQPVNGFYRALVERLDLSTPSVPGTWSSLVGIPGDVQHTNAVVNDGCVVVVDARGAPAAWILAREATN